MVTDDHGFCSYCERKHQQQQVCMLRAAQALTGQVGALEALTGNEIPFVRDMVQNLNIVKLVEQYLIENYT